MLTLLIETIIALIAVAILGMVAAVPLLILSCAKVRIPNHVLTHPGDLSGGGNRSQGAEHADTYTPDDFEVYTDSDGGADGGAGE